MNKQVSLHVFKNELTFDLSTILCDVTNSQSRILVAVQHDIQNRKAVHAEWCHNAKGYM